MGDMVACKVDPVDNTAEDMEAFKGEYLANQKVRFKWLEKSKCKLKIQCRRRNASVLAVLGHLPEIVTEEIAKRLDDRSVACMTMACKPWAKWLLPGRLPQDWEILYAQTLEAQHRNGVMTVRRGGNIVERYCRCREKNTEDEKDWFHLSQRVTEMEYQLEEYLDAQIAN